LVDIVVPVNWFDRTALTVPNFIKIGQTVFRIKL